MKSLSHWLHQHPQEHPSRSIQFSVPRRWNDGQKATLQGKLLKQEAPGSKTHNLLGARPPFFARFRSVGQCTVSHLAGIVPSDSLGGLSFLAHEFHFGFVNAIVLIYLCET